MKDFEFELDYKAFGEQVLRSKDLEKILKEYADNIRDHCGDGYESSSTKGRLIDLAMVWPATYEARLDNSENNTLLKAMGEVRE